MNLMCREIIFLFIFFVFFVLYSTLLHLPPLRFHCVHGSGIEPRTVAIGALAVRRSNHYKLDLVRNYRLDLIRTRLDLIRREIIGLWNKVQLSN